MRHPHATWLIPLGLAITAFGVRVAMLAIAGRNIHYRVLANLSVALILGLLGYATVLTWRRLWRRGRDPWEGLVYDSGVRGFGALMVLGLPLIMLWSTRSSGDMLTYGDALMSLLMGIALAGPLGLWAGYLWGRLFAFAFGVQRSERAKQDLPPTV
jgi:hypothetical protein